jgi:ATP-dependent DNA ligase
MAPKWDGFRYVAVIDDDRGVQLTSRRLKRLNEAFPEIVEAVFEHLPARTVVDGEIVRWSEEGRLDFGALQRRNAAGRRAGDLAQTAPCHYVVSTSLKRAVPTCEADPCRSGMRACSRRFRALRT